MQLLQQSWKTAEKAKVKEFEATPHALLIITSIAIGRAIFFSSRGLMSLFPLFFLSRFISKKGARREGEINQTHTKGISKLKWDFLKRQLSKLCVCFLFMTYVLKLDHVSYHFFIFSISNCEWNNEMKFVTFRYFSVSTFKIFFLVRPSASVLRRGPAGSTGRRVRQLTANGFILIEELGRDIKWWYECSLLWRGIVIRRRQDNDTLGCDKTSVISSLQR